MLYNYLFYFIAHETTPIDLFLWPRLRCLCVLAGRVVIIIFPIPIFSGRWQVNLLHVHVLACF